VQLSVEAFGGDRQWMSSDAAGNICAIGGCTAPSRAIAHVFALPMLGMVHFTICVDKQVWALREGGTVQYSGWPSPLFFFHEEAGRKADDACGDGICA
jgi:hypothetical protein